MQITDTFQSNSSHREMSLLLPAAFSLLVALYFGITLAGVENLTWLRYLVLWMMIAAVVLFFMLKFSFSARLGYYHNVMELPAYISLQALLIEGLFGVIAVIDPQYLAPQVGGVDYIVHGLGLSIAFTWMP